MEISEAKFGELPDGRDVTLYTLQAGDLKFSLTDYGAAWAALFVPSKGGAADILLGFSDFESYLNNNKPYFGVTVGRFSNRIRGASFTLDGKTRNLEKNDGKHTLHGGTSGFNKYLWKAHVFKEKDGVFVRFELESPHGEGGYPGNLKAAVCYGLTKSNEITASYEARLDKNCPVSLTNHAYFNMAGSGAGNILLHEFCIHASSYVEIDDEYIPTGRLLPVKNTAFDFRKRKRAGADMEPAYGGAGSLEGYDHCYAVDGSGERLCAEVFEPASGRSMKVFTTQPGVQFYTGNMLPKSIEGKNGAVYTKHSGFCLETQHFPDSPNQTGFPSAIFGPSRDYGEKARFAFDW